MKVVLFCGGMGMRLREFSETIPKPMVPIGSRPIIWHMMKLYAHYNHKDFLLCLGYQGEYIKKYFLNYDECLSNDFVLSNGGATLELANRDISDWSISFIDTGLRTNIGGRLAAVKRHVENEEVFLANYTDGLCDVDISAMVESFMRTDAIAGFLRVRPNFSFHIVDTDEDGQVNHITTADRSGLWSNGGFFVLRREIFDYMEPGEELVEEPFQRLIQERKLFAFTHHGFWACMDTFKEKQQLDDLYHSGLAPWQVWSAPDVPVTV